LFTGYRQDLPSVYAALDIFVLPSFNEGLPMTVIEAMASGTPVIASRVGAIPAVITHEQTGLLVEPGDTHGLARALDRLLGDPNLRHGLGQQGREHVRQHYTSRVMADQYLRMYEKVLEARRALFTLRDRPFDESRTGVNRV
jgi:glycosyltransferase involved in cell wall biosynthesis